MHFTIYDEELLTRTELIEGPILVMVLETYCPEIL